MNDRDKRPLPKSWAERLRERIAEKAPKPALKVEPKRVRHSGPNIAGDRWHLPLSQAEMNAEAEGLLGKPCADCGAKVVKASGDLIMGLYCGACFGARMDASSPPSAA